MNIFCMGISYSFYLGFSVCQDCWQQSADENYACDADELIRVSWNFCIWEHGRVSLLNCMASFADSRNGIPLSITAKKLVIILRNATTVVRRRPW